MVEWGGKGLETVLPSMEAVDLSYLNGPNCTKWNLLASLEHPALSSAAENNRV